MPLSTPKTCSKCGVTKPTEEFHLDKKGRDGRSARCKECARNHVKAWSKAKFPKRYATAEAKKVERLSLLAEGKKRCAKCGEIKSLEGFYCDPRKKDGLYGKCRSCHDAVVRAWENANPDRKYEIGAACKARHRERIAALKRERRKVDATFRAKEIAISKRWKVRNAERVEKYKAAYRSDPEKKLIRNKTRAERLRTDPAFKAEVNIRRRIIKALKGEQKSQKTLELLGCSYEQFIQHIESLFKVGMTWENYGYRGWHLDHYIPCAAFDLTDPEQQKKCFHFTNLQPMWWKDNLLKRDSIPT